MRLFAKTASDAFESPLLVRAGLVLLCVDFAGFLTQAWWILSGDPKPGWFSDSVDYLILADFFSGESARNPASLSFAFFGTSRFPPLFPLLLALGGAGVRSWTVAYWICLATGMISILTTYLWLRQQTGRSFAAAGMIPLAILSPQYFILHLEIMSESQFMVLMTLTLFLTTSYQQRRCSLVLLAFVAGLLPLSRTAGIAMLMALSIWLLLRDTRRSVVARLLACTVLWLPSLIWIGYRKLLPIQTDYLNVLTAATAIDDSQGLFRHAMDTFARLIRGFTAWFDLVGEPATQVLVALILVAATYGWWQRLRMWQIDALFLPIYLGLVFVWPYPAETARLLAVTMPIVALSTWHGLESAFRASTRSGARSFAPVASTLIMLAMCAATAGPTWADIARRATARLDPALDSTKRNSAYFATRPAELAPFVVEVMTRFVELAKTTPTVVPKGECVWTSFMTATAFFSDLRLIPRQIPADIVDSASAKRLLSGCEYVIVASLVSPQLQLAPLYPLSSIESFSQPILASYIEVGGTRQLAAALLKLKKQPF